MTDEQLIKDTAKAIWFARHVGDNVEWGEMAWAEQTAPDDWSSEALDALDAARAAWVVFEAAHAPTDDTIPQYAMLDLHSALYGVEADFDAFYREHEYAEAWSRLLGAVRELRAAPTDDEREALQDALKYLDTLHADRQIWYDDYSNLHDLVSSALRHSEVPEPSTDDAMSHYTDPADPFWQSPPEPQGEPSDAQDRDLTEIEARAVTTAAALAQATGMTIAEVIATVNQIGGEPSDAQVDAAGELLYGISWGTDIADPDLVRDALRAAGVVGQEGEQR